MKWSKFNIENTQKYIIDIKQRYEVIEGLTIKLSKQFINFIEKTIEHIKRYKIIYKRFVVYLALCMFLYTVPDIIYIIESFDYAGFITQIKNTPRNIVINSILYMIKSIACYSVMILTVKDIIKISLKSIKTFK